MARKPAAPKKPKPLFTRNEVVGLCKRFLKENAYDPARDPMVLYRLLKQFPDRNFWLNYTMIFQLNALFWFLGKDGQEKLKQDYSIFCLNLAPVIEEKIEDEKVGEDVIIEKKPKTMAQLLR